MRRSAGEAEGGKKRRHVGMCSADSMCAMVVPMWVRRWHRSRQGRHGCGFVGGLCM